MLLAFLFIIFGLIAIFRQRNIRNTAESYTVKDLIAGWGIYACTIGLLLKFPKFQKYILGACFLSSMMWHCLIAKRMGWTKHHRDSIFINSIALLLLVKN
tara:strand:- start:64 stop:363 length:300 start_codon:yes stop_codon:yes gene_type:complete